MTCPICGKLYCDHSPAERGQSFDEMMEDMRAPHIISDKGLTQRVTQSEYDARMGKSRKDHEASTNKPVTIRRMELCDLDEVKKIQDSYSYWKMDPDQAQRGGFFLKLLEEKELSEHISNPSSCDFVYATQRGISGYLLASFRNNSTIDDRIRRALYRDEFSTRSGFSGGNHLFVEYVAKKKQASAKVVLDLEQRLFDEAITLGCEDTVGLIAHTPYNKCSWEFHMKKDWRYIGWAADEIHDKLIEWAVVYRDARWST